MIKALSLQGSRGLWFPSTASNSEIKYWESNSHVSIPSSPIDLLIMRLTFAFHLSGSTFYLKWFRTLVQKGINALTSLCDSSLQKEWSP